MIAFRPAVPDDLPAIVALLRDDALGAGREVADLGPYRAAFAAMAAEAGNHQMVGADDRGVVIACYQLTVTTGLSLRGARRATLEGVRIAAALRGQGLGARLLADAEALARAAGAALIQLTSNAARADARRFYERAGYVPSHVGFKKPL